MSDAILCDNCGVPLGPAHADKWFQVRSRLPEARMDFCGAPCLANWAHGVAEEETELITLAMKGKAEPITITKERAE